MIRGLALAAVHLAIVLSLTAKYAWDRERLPRAWARTMNYDPNLPVRGRYVSLRPIVMLDGPTVGDRVIQGTLSVRDGQLAATLVESGGVPLWSASRQPGAFMTSLRDPVAFFIPEHAPDPTILKPGEELWVELSVPPKGEPRPLRLAVKKPDGTFTPLELR